MYDIKLYVASSGSDLHRITSKLRSALENKFGGGFSFEVINVLEQPELAARDGILATPTAVRLQPEPRVRVIGNFQDMRLVLDILGLNGDGGDPRNGCTGEEQNEVAGEK